MGTPPVLLTTRRRNSALRGSLRRSLMASFAFAIQASFLSFSSGAACRWASCFSNSACASAILRAWISTGSSKGKQADMFAAGNLRSSARTGSLRAPARRSLKSIRAVKLASTSASDLGSRCKASRSESAISRPLACTSSASSTGGHWACTPLARTQAKATTFKPRLTLLFAGARRSQSIPSARLTPVPTDKADTPALRL